MKKTKEAIKSERKSTPSFISTRMTTFYGDDWMKEQKNRRHFFPKDDDDEDQYDDDYERLFTPRFTGTRRTVVVKSSVNE